MGTTCINCNYESKSATDNPTAACPSCGRIYAKMMAAQSAGRNDKETRKKTGMKKSTKLIMVSLAIIVFVGFLGKFHIIWGSHIDLVSITAKPSFTFSETFINTDEIAGMPLIAAMSKYPLSIQALEKRVHYLLTESETARMAVRDVIKTAAKLSKPHRTAVSLELIDGTSQDELRSGNESYGLAAASEYRSKYTRG